MKRVEAVIAVAVLCTCLCGVRADDKGTCGNNISWYYNEESKVLTLNGTGPMTNYGSSSYIPWKDYKSDIERVEFIGEITTISSFAFIRCPLLSSVTLPDSITTLGSSCFGGCTSLRSFTIPKSVTSVEIPVPQCNNLTEIKVAADNPYFKSVDGVLYSKDGTSLLQYPCGKQITKFNVSSKVTYVGPHSFEGCRSLTYVYIPDTVLNVEYGAFLGCSSLISVHLPSGIVSLGTQFFYKCTSLKMVEIPGTVTSLGYEAFGYISNLTKLSYGGLSTPSEDNSFRSCTGLKSVCVPSGYQSDSFCGKSIQKSDTCHDVLCADQSEPGVSEACADHTPASSGGVGGGSAGVVAEANMMLVVCLLAVMTLLILF